MPRQEQPLEPDGTVLYEFAAGLRRIRELAGGPTYRELSRRAHYSVAALSEAAAGRKLPSLAVTIAYAGACGADTAVWEQRWRQVAAELTPPDDEVESDLPAPYVGLAAFQPEDAGRFFGRDEVVLDLLRRIRARRLVGVFGASGSGKSSVLRAGVAATAMARGVFDTGPQPVVLLTPGPQPRRECAARLAELTGDLEESVLAELTGPPDTLRSWIHRAMAGRPDDEDLLLIVDQFEETFTLCQDPAERAWFIDALVRAGAGRARVVLGVRAYFYGHCGLWPALVEAFAYQPPCP
ncbi:helix-turn-helix transcriptional regulator [Actinophytocola sp.]|uniref:helix-turn-helix domain-containing protein n=1 Tax=Actinophytocola sp. TaxID=1872138 RepID=UPI002D80A1C3|nr:helix-turn-helix transcriptional regulator [Actinophytocola sp.]HET9139873.1 helix-turn-helix transcriptional regulator [Actinophytocola sp.]